MPPIVPFPAIDVRRELPGSRSRPAPFPRPSVGPRPEGEAVDGWIRLSKAKDPGEILDILAEEARSDSTDDGLRLARRLLGLSRLAARKHRRTRVATFILTAAVILFVISAIASVGGLVGVA